MMRITKCPTCGSTEIEEAMRDWTGEFQGKKYPVEALLDPRPSNRAG